MQLEISVLSKAGGRQVNEDACGFWSAPDACFCVLSDGLGGHYGGDVASKLVVRNVLDWFHETPECSALAVETAMHTANAAIMQEQRRDPQLTSMRATAVVLAIDTENGMAIWGHLGDSRLYCLRQRRIIMQTRDHSVVQNMVDAGYLQPHDLRTSPQRNKLFAALGDAHCEPRVEPLKFSLQDGDVFLLCSDGLWEYVEEEEMERTLGEATSVADWLQVLENLVLTRGRTGQDNYSAIVVWCSDPNETSRRIS